MNELRQKRKELGLTQIEAAKICGVSRRSFQYYEENDEYEEMRRKVLEILDNAEKNRIFGSYARKEATGKSDVDILVVCPAMGMKFYHLAGELKEALGKQVDLQTHRQIGDNPDFLENLLTEGVLIYDKRKRFNSSEIFIKTNRNNSE